MPGETPLEQAVRLTEAYGYAVADREVAAAAANSAAAVVPLTDANVAAIDAAYDAGRARRQAEREDTSFEDWKKRHVAFPDSTEGPSFVNVLDVRYLYDEVIALRRKVAMLEARP